LKPLVVQQLGDASTLEAQRSALILDAAQVLATQPSLTGGKGSSLAVLNSIVAVEVPKFFCVTTNAFRAHFETESGRQMLATLQKLSDVAVESGKQPDLMASFEQARLLREHIQTAPLGAETEAAIKAAYAQLCGEQCDIPVAVRSSATTEDTKDASFAGQHDTFFESAWGGRCCQQCSAMLGQHFY